MSRPQSATDTPDTPNDTLAIAQSRPQELGVASLTHVVRGHSETRTIYYRDDLIIPEIERQGQDVPPGGRRDSQSQSNCTLFEEEEQQSACFCFRDTEIDNSSSVFNGSIAPVEEVAIVRKHHLHGGQIKNKSKFVNGDLDRDTFLAFFCRD
ncbi:hypothetical protein ASPZODRAFT_137234 [Penicilliopsis zonata CBS 506.65]|uniref:Uncharacterized protein n=1 Tax=Penicilliopsis zonata CBS 506.65 TaxID=1073090 RepID=A0A1L9S628_9EURO|nr:hypothetical protein ASPZODRAFT_137234 [Penicilliopsis zonata CBS 506.65]OJJ42629.1 hypothetical protein ASPZODRAFT_137234 [Penicilliopsis zonata CBS 506.65]